jgi:hypothetical protein
MQFNSINKHWAAIWKVSSGYLHGQCPSVQQHNVPCQITRSAIVSQPRSPFLDNYFVDVFESLILSLAAKAAVFDYTGVGSKEIVPALVGIAD